MAIASNTKPSLASGKATASTVNQLATPPAVATKPVVTFVNLAAATPAQITTWNATTASNNQLVSLLMGATQSQVNQLSAAQITALGNLVSNLSPAALAGLTGSAVAGITAAQIGALNPNQLAAIGHFDWLPAAAFAGLTAATIGVIRTGNPHALANWSWMSAAQIAALTPAAFAALTPAQIAQISNGNQGAGSGMGIQGITAAQIGALNPNQLAAIGHFDWLPAAAFAGLTAATIGVIRTGNPHALANWSWMSAAQIAALTPAAFAALTPAQIAQISNGNQGAGSGMGIQGITAAQIGALNPNQLAAIGHFDWLPAAAFAGLTAATIGVIRTGNPHALANWSWMSAAQIAALTPAAFAALTPAQIAQISNGNQGAGSGMGIQGITAAQIGALNPNQLAAIGHFDWLPAATKKRQLTQVKSADVASNPSASSGAAVSTTSRARGDIYDVLGHSQNAPMGYEMVNGHLEKKIQPHAISWQGLSKAGGFPPPDGDYPSVVFIPGHRSKVHDVDYVPPRDEEDSNDVITMADLLAASAEQIRVWRSDAQGANKQLQQLMTEFTADQSVKLRKEQVEALDSLVTLLSAAAIRGMTIAGIAGMSATILMQASTAAGVAILMDALTQYQIQNLPTSTITGLTARALESTVVITGRSVLASLYNDQLGAISKSALGGLTLADLMQTSVLTPNGQSISVLQAMPWTNLAQLSQVLVGALTSAQLALTNLQETALTSVSVRSVLQGLTSAQVQQINITAVHNLSSAQLMQINASGHQVWQDIILNPAQASYLPSAYQWQNLTSTQVTSLFANLAQAATVATLNPTVLTAIPTASLVNGILGMSAVNASAFITGMSTAQLAQLNPNAVNGLITSAAAMANVFLNVGAAGSLTVDQFQAVIAGSTNLGQLNARVLGNTLSVSALQSLSTAQIGQLTAEQLGQILVNPTLSKVIYNAGSGNGYWTVQQLQAVSSGAIAYMTQEQYLQFANGLSMFSQTQQNAMSTNVALLEIMITGQTNVWTQDQIAWIVQNIPEMIPLSGLLGGGNGGSKGGNSENVGLAYQIPNYATMVNPVQILAAISSTGWSALELDDRTALLSNHALSGVLTSLSQEQLINVMSNADLLARLNGVNFTALIEPINQFFPMFPIGTVTNFATLNHNQIAALITADGGLIALRLIAQYAPDTLLGGALSAENVTALITVNGGLNALGAVAQHAHNALPGGTLSADNVTALITAEGGLNALERIAHYAPNALPGGAFSADNVATLITVNNGPSALRYIAQYAPNTLPGGAFSADNVTALITSENGLNVLRYIAHYAPNALPGGAFSADNVATLITVNNGPSALGYIAQYAPNTLPGGAFSADNVTALITSENGLNVLRYIAQYAHNALPGGALSADNVTALITVNNGPSALGYIAQYAPNTLPDGALSADNVTALITVNNGPVALRYIAQYASESFAVGAVNADNVTALITVNNGPSALRYIAQYAPNTLPDGALSADNVTALITVNNGPVALGYIAQYASNSFAVGAVNADNVTALITVNNGPVALGYIAQYASNSFAVGAVNADNVTALITVNNGPAALSFIAMNAPNTLPDGALSADNVAALITVNNGPATLWHIAHYAPNALPGGAFSADNVATLITVNNGPSALRYIAQYAPNTLLGVVLSANNVTALMTSEHGLDALGYIAQYAPNTLPVGALSADNVAALITVNNGLNTLRAIAQYASNSFSVGALSADNVAALITVNNGLNTLRAIAQYAPNSFAVGAVNVNQLTIFQGTANGIATIFNVPALAVGLDAASIANITANSENFNGALAHLNAGGIAIVLNNDSLRAAITANGAAALMANASLSNAYLNVGAGGQQLIVAHIGALTAPQLLHFVEANGNWLTPAILPAPGAAIYAQIPAANITVNVIQHLSGTPVGLFLLNQLPSAVVNGVGGATQGAQTTFYGGMSQETFSNLLNGAPQFLNYLNATPAATLSQRHLADLTLVGLRGLLETANNAGTFLSRIASGRPEALQTIPDVILAALSPTQASLLVVEFWESITVTQLTAMFSSPTLGAAFFGNANTPNHISQANFNAINEIILAESVVAVPAIQAAILSSWAQLTAVQRDAIAAQGIAGFMPPQNDLALTGNPLTINQHIINGTRLLAESIANSNNASLMGSAQSAFTEVQELIITNYQGEVATGAIWDKESAVTVSAAGFTNTQMAQLSSVLSEYGAITGLSFQMVEAGGQINLGFANLATATTGSVGLTTITAANGQMQSAQIVLEEASHLNAIGNYAGTDASFNQVLLHEIGHALGLADNNLAGSIENYYLGSNNQVLSAADIAALQTLYGPSTDGLSAIDNLNPSAGLITVAGIHQLIQAMASAHTPVGAVTTSTGTFMSAPGTSNPLTLVSNAVH